MAQDFYPFVENGDTGQQSATQVSHPARIAVYDDAAAAPRVVTVEPSDVRSYLEEITLQVTQLAQGQGGTIPFMVIREIVENFIHAYFIEPTISILDHGNTIRFSDQGPGIREKERALQYGTTSATEEMRRYIRGVGSGLPYAQQYMVDKGGSLQIEDNIAGGTVVTISTRPTQVPAAQAPQQLAPQQPAAQAWQGAPTAQTWPYAQPNPTWQQATAPGWQQQAAAPVWPQQQAYQSQSPYQQPQQMPAWPQQAYPAQPVSAPAAAGMQMPQQAAPQQAAPQPPAQDFSWIQVSVRGRAVLDYLATHDAVGPSDLARTYGESQPTWTRELQALEEQGLIRKDGQKRRLTSMGAAFIGK